MLLRLLRLWQLLHLLAGQESVRALRLQHFASTGCRHLRGQLLMDCMRRYRNVQPMSCAHRLGLWAVLRLKPPKPQLEDGSCILV